MRRRGESNFRIEIFTNIGHGQKGQFGTPCPELVLLTFPNVNHTEVKPDFNTKRVMANLKV